MAPGGRRHGTPRRSDRVAVILDRLAGTGALDVGEMAVELGVSQATLRRDLAVLDEQRLLTRTHGGAVAREVAYEMPVRYRTSQHHQQKQAIARAALRGLGSGPLVVAVTGGTTTSQIALLLANRTELTVITNALNIALELALRPRLKVIVTGGVARANSFELVGPWAERTIQSVNIDTAFIGVDGVSAAGGLSTHDEVEAHTNALMLTRARRSVVVADGSKVGRDRLAHIADVTAVNELVTDSSAAQSELAAIRACGVTVTIADLAHPNGSRPLATVRSDS